MKKIMFNDKYGLTEAVLEGRKTMTRRLISEDVWQRADVYRHEYYEDTLELIPEKKAFIEFSPFEVGEAVAVAQAYRDAINPLDWVNTLIYKNEPGWTNKMFVGADLMPHQIFINAVRVERLQDISDEDCLREGIYLDETAPSCYQPFYTFKESQEHGTPVGYQTAREAFAALIDKVSGKGTWQSNPWVFVYEFALVK